MRSIVNRGFVKQNQVLVDAAAAVEALIDHQRLRRTVRGEIELELQAVTPERLCGTAIACGETARAVEISASIYGPTAKGFRPTGIMLP